LPDEPLLGFIEIPAGEFLMGSDKQRDKQAFEEESPPHSVHLPGYYLARWPVTVAQFTAFIQASGYRSIDPNSLKGIPNHPVVYVSWHDAVAYCRWLGERMQELARECLAEGKPLPDTERAFWQGLADGTLGVGLPSEAEWEKAARGTDGRIYPWGDKPGPDRANYGDTGLNTTTTVGCFSRGVSPYGCEEMSGNMWEWTRSLWGKAWENPTYRYPYDPSDGREALDAPDTIRRVLRGGSFGGDPQGVCCAYRFHFDPVGRDDGSGFRVVVSPFFFSGR
jgi:formylglycine-generating enzyme required for sulfatase activity